MRPCFAAGSRSCFLADKFRKKLTGVIPLLIVRDDNCNKAYLFLENANESALTQVKPPSSVISVIDK